ncbi:hypothetical protein M409DRAFT_22240 [Zasmidium cellare ATCC 36951]|uniref:Uncharacterized protein n=1 Tax=Zasmidium cellare ATCC 36951 TaxID=1080233 RepID=A0A6A6CK61_ZASCE|nr:uncharacterized protein M409DRAFT_22240 [Zasmidium cellare ATCC 36951]KAF2167431.1 hypothetical protein M409DRAFT_22240 [Zasmidium cellare ATCC 36951]
MHFKQFTTILVALSFSAVFANPIPDSGIDVCVPPPHSSPVGSRLTRQAKLSRLIKPIKPVKLIKPIKLIKPAKVNKPVKVNRLIKLTKSTKPIKATKPTKPPRHQTLIKTTKPRRASSTGAVLQAINTGVPTKTLSLAVTPTTRTAVATTPHILVQTRGATPTIHMVAATSRTIRQAPGLVLVQVPPAWNGMAGLVVLDRFAPIAMVLGALAMRDLNQAALATK